MATPGLKRKQQLNLQPYGQGGVSLSPPEPARRDGRKRRLYFRCSYREDRHCQASKLVQQVTQDDPPLYEVTYMYEHTCNAAPVPTPGVEAEDEPPAATAGGLVLRWFVFSGSHYRRSLSRDPDALAVVARLVRCLSGWAGCSKANISDELNV
ncbi:putative WRKY transcription factor 48 [Panicum miliaceum]|uniref:WRKY transcription factor 48 n=1 Tax=Panicum miliaceum TaxID=4540 RepID=A0A3L6Q8H1_PANMI|nr:putative WRKY transcription factor 48 [Panicum miliaceum]